MRLLKEDAPKLCKRIFDFLVSSCLGFLRETGSGTLPKTAHQAVFGFWEGLELSLQCITSQSTAVHFDEWAPQVAEQLFQSSSRRMLSLLKELASFPTTMPAD